VPIDDPFGLDHLDIDGLRARPGVKWHRARGRHLAAWVADMDFRPPPAVLERLRDYVDGGDLGYPDFRPTNGLAELFSARMAARHGWTADPAHVVDLCDVVQGVRLVTHLLSAPGDGIAFHTPAYPPFLATSAGMNRPLVPIRAVRAGDGWSFDVERFRAELAAQPCRVLVLCNPHNPTGRVFTRGELEELAEIVVANDLVVISDEIHAELLHDGRRHIPFASLGAEVAARTTTLTSATKAFNLAGIRCAQAHVSDPRVRAALAAQPDHLYGAVSPFGVLATAAAWTEGDEWQRAVLARLGANRHLLGELLAARPALARIDYAVPEATYLAWLDCRALGLGDDPSAAFRDHGGVELSPGPDFGEQGLGFARLNLATAPNVLTAVVDAMADAVTRAR
jgi:cystathionine beta-lyase